MLYTTAIDSAYGDAFSHVGTVASCRNRRSGKKKPIGHYSAGGTARVEYYYSVRPALVSITDNSNNNKRIFITCVRIYRNPSESRRASTGNLAKTSPFAVYLYGGTGRGYETRTKTRLVEAVQYKRVGCGKIRVGQKQEHSSSSSSSRCRSTLHITRVVVQ